MTEIRKTALTFLVVLLVAAAGLADARADARRGGRFVGGYGPHHRGGHEVGGHRAFHPLRAILRHL